MLCAARRRELRLERLSLFSRPVVHSSRAQDLRHSLCILLVKRRLRREGCLPGRRTTLNSQSGESTSHSSSAGIVALTSNVQQCFVVFIKS